jgi:hypothetical protein
VPKNSGSRVRGYRPNSAGIEARCSRDFGKLDALARVRLQSLANLLESNLVKGRYQEGR